MTPALLAALGISTSDRRAIEGLQLRRSSVSHGLDQAGNTEEEIATSAIIRLAHKRPEEVALMQRRTGNWLLRPFPLGLRFSGKNMSPLPCWLAGAQHIAYAARNQTLAIRF